MIISTLIFFDASFTKALNYIAKIFSSGIVLFENEKRKYNVSITAIKQKWFIGLFCSPTPIAFRYICYPNELFWNEEGFRSLGV
jgi:hypothetical protein